MALSKAERRVRNRNIMIGAAVVLVFMGMQSKSLMQRLLAPSRPGYSKEAPPGEHVALDWAQLQETRWMYGSKPELPEVLGKLEGQRVRVRGFMLPLHNPGQSSQWFVSEMPRGCYFCNPPGVTEIMLVNMAGDKELSPGTWQVDVYGKLHIATGAREDTVLYTLDDASVVVAF